MEIKPYLRRPQFYETDGMSIIWHGNYVRWMEEARTDFMDQLGFPYARAVEAGIDFALTDISCKYRAMTRFGEELAITVFIRRLSPAKLELGYEMREASTGAQPGAVSGAALRVWSRAAGTIGTQPGASSGRHSRQGRKPARSASAAVLKKVQFSGLGRRARHTGRQ